jgi:transposase
MWCIPPEANGEFVWRMEDVLDIYKQPYDPQRPQVCLDEKSVQLLGEARAPLPAAPGRPVRQDSEYQRNGTANIFLAVEPLGNWRRIEVTQQRTKKDFAHFVKDLVDGRYRDADRIVLVMDNLNTHSPASLYEAFEPAEAKRIAGKLEIHHTPKHGSWLNMAEIELSVLGRRLVERLADRGALASACAAVEQERNQSGAGIDWRFTTPDARIKLKRLYPSLEA